MFVTGNTVISTAGKDKDLFSAVVKTDDTYVYVCDGKHNPLDNPKRKNPKHIKAVGIDLTEEQMVSNRALRKALASVRDAKR